jgi:hypothetical protein
LAAKLEEEKKAEEEKKRVEEEEAKKQQEAAAAAAVATEAAPVGDVPAVVEGEAKKEEVPAKKSTKKPAVKK